VVQKDVTQVLFKKWKKKQNHPNDDSLTKDDYRHSRHSRLLCRQKQRRRASTPPAPYREADEAIDLARTNLWR